MARVKQTEASSPIDFGADMVKVPKNTFDGDFPLNKIKPRTDKSRYYADIEREGLKDSILRWGFTEPLVLNPDFQVIHGNLRYEIAKNVLGLSTVPVIILSQKSYEYHLYANRLQDWGMWNHAVTDVLLLQTDKVPAPPIVNDRVNDWDADEARGAGIMSSRTALRKIGWFTNDVPESLVAQSFTLEKVAEEIVSRERSQIYQFNPEQLLFVARTRRALLRYFEDPANVSLKDKERPKDKDPKVAEELFQKKLQEKLDYYEAIAADIREYDFDLNPDGSKLKRREEVSEAILEVLVKISKDLHPELEEKSDEEILESISTGEFAVPARDFQKAMKRLDIFGIIESLDSADSEEDQD